MPDPTRPAIISAVSTGPSSLIIDAPTRRPTSGRAPNWSSVKPDCSASTAPVKSPVSSTTVSDPTPMASNCSTMSREVERPRDRARARPARESATYSCTSSSAALTQLERSASARRHARRAAAAGPARALRSRLSRSRKRGRPLELEVGGRRLHLALQTRDQRVELRLRAPRRPARGGSARRHVVALVHARQHVVDLLDDRRRRDAVLLVVGLLPLARRVGLADRPPASSRSSRRRT